MQKNMDDPYSITQERAIELIEEKRKKDREKLIKDLGEVQVINGRFGPYLTYDGANYKIPKGTDCPALTLEACMEIISKQAGKPTSKKTSKTAAKKTSTAKKTSKDSVSAAKKTTKKK